VIITLIIIGDIMPTIYLRRDLYDEIVRRGYDVTEYVNKVVENALKTEQPKPEEEARKKR